MLLEPTKQRQTFHPHSFSSLSRSLILFLSPSRYIPLSFKAPFMIVVEKCVVDVEELYLHHSVGVNVSFHM